MKKIILSLLLFSSQVFADSNFYTMSTKELAQINSRALSKNVIERIGDLSILKLDRSEVLNLAELVHENLNKCGGFMYQDSLAKAQETARNHGNRKSIPTPKYEITKTEDVLSRIDLVSEFNLTNTITKLSSFHSRFCYSEIGNESSLYINELWKDLTKNRTDASSEVIYHDDIDQPSIILTIKGTKFPDEIVILGGHADSIAYGSGTPRAPGADDNASGIATVTEVIRILVDTNYKPERTLQFIAYAAEEVGLVGSQAIADSYKSNSKNVVGVMQLDMTLFKGSHDSDIILIKDYTNEALTTFVGSLIDTYVKVPWTYSACGYACSDHASWTKAGYPSVFPFESVFKNSNKMIHSQNDTLKNSGGNSLHAVSFSKLALAFVIETAL